MSKLKNAINKIADMVQEDVEHTKNPVENIKGVYSATISKQKGKAKQEAKKGVNIVETARQNKERKVKEYRREASRLASMANKRIARLEQRGFIDSPAYKTYLASGGGKFGVRGKTYNEVQAEVARLNSFLNANTSTISGLNNYLKDMAKNTGIKYTNMQELYNKSSKFFELANKVEEYLRTVEDMASAIGYQKIWEAVNIYTSKNKINLGDSKVDIDSMIKQVSDALTEHQKPENMHLNKGAFITNSGLKKSSWFKLDKKEE